MLAKKNSFRGAILLLALTMLAAGCTPAGPRALMKGKRYLDRGDYEDAAAQLKTATTLMATNASAWNYYGVALQSAGHPDEAAKAYTTAMQCDRDLVEAHYNLGSLGLEQGKPDLAKTEFTAYTMHRPNEAAGWLKLGTAQLRLGENVAAERSFSTVYHLDPSNPEALNGLGMARVQSGKPEDAAKFFSAAVQARADYAPAILNLATVNQQYLHNNKAALEYYHAYLNLKTRPANWADVNAVAAGLEASEGRPTTVAMNTPPQSEKPATASTVTETKLPVEAKPTRVSNVVTQRQVVATRPTTTPTTRPSNTGSTTPRPVPVEVVEVQPEKPIVTTPRGDSTPVATTQPQPANGTPDPTSMETPVPDTQPKKGFWGHIFGGAKSPTPDSSKYMGAGLTPLPGDTDAPAATKPALVQPAKPLEVVQPVPVFAKYNYFSPRRPAAGDRTAASGAFTKARLAEQDENWADALQWYQQAAVLDPSWFEAQYNAGVIAHRLHNFTSALPRYELALAIQPDSVDARYNFALALKAAGYAPDAAEQLKIVLKATPNEVRAHLALANICAQSLRDNALAREHYQRVLQLDPENSQAADIRFWLSANPK